MKFLRETSLMETTAWILAGAMTLVPLVPYALAS